MVIILKEWAIPGGMRDPGEIITKTLVREFAEEALSHNLKYDKSDRIEVKAGNIEEKLEKFFKNGTIVKKNIFLYLNLNKKKIYLSF